MEAREAFERFEHNLHEAGGMGFARAAAIVVAILAAFLAVSTFLANEAIKEAINGETRSAHVATLLAANEEKLNQAQANALLLKVVGEGSSKEQHAAAAAMVIEHRIENRLKPVDARMKAEVVVHEQDRDHANDDHFIYELSVVGLQLGIVLASVSIITARRWLLTAGAGAGVVGVALLVFGLLLN